MSTDGATKEEVEKVEKELAGTIKVRTSSPSSSASNSSSRPRVTTAALESLAGHLEVAVKELKSKNTTAATCTLACAQAVAGGVLATTSNADVVADTGAGVTVINPSNKRPTNVRVTDPAASISIGGVVPGAGFRTRGIATVDHHQPVLAPLRHL